jgi:F0F1-type ATP synthase membrane subunit b/b'
LADIFSFRKDPIGKALADAEEKIQKQIEEVEKRGEGYDAVNERLQPNIEKHLEQGSGRDQ